MDSNNDLQDVNHIYG